MTKQLTSSGIPQGNSLTPDAMKKIALEQYANQQKQDLVTKYGFPTEIIELPSQGKVYPEGHPLTSGKLEMRYMTARDEDILLTPSLISQNLAITKLMEGLIISNGEGLPVKYGDLVLGDKDASIIAARVLGYGKEYVLSITDPYAEKLERVSYPVDLTKLDHKPLHEDILNSDTPGLYTITLPASKLTLTFKLTTHAIESKVEKLLQKSKDDVNREITATFKEIIVAIDDTTDKAEIAEWVDNDFLAIDSRAFKKYLAELSPGIVMEFDFIPPSDPKESIRMKLQVDQDFFWSGV